MALNLKHQFFAAQIARRSMRELGGGAIVNFSSTAWMLGVPRLSVYATAKAAVVGPYEQPRARVRARQHPRQRHRAWRGNHRAAAPPLDERGSTSPTSATRQCINRTLVAEDVARLALFLSSDDSAMITKQCYQCRWRTALVRLDKNELDRAILWAHLRILWRPQQKTARIRGENDDSCPHSGRKGARRFHHSAASHPEGSHRAPGRKRRGSRGRIGRFAQRSGHTFGTRRRPRPRQTRRVRARRSRVALHDARKSSPRRARTRSTMSWRR